MAGARGNMERKKKKNKISWSRGKRTGGLDAYRVYGKQSLIMRSQHSRAIIYSFDAYFVIYVKRSNYTSSCNYMQIIIMHHRSLRWKFFSLSLFSFPLEAVTELTLEINTTTINAPLNVSHGVQHYKLYTVDRFEPTISTDCLFIELRARQSSDRPAKWSQSYKHDCYSLSRE